MLTQRASAQHYQLELIRYEIHFCGVLIDYFDQLLNHLPFWLPANIYSEFLHSKTELNEDEEKRKQFEEALKQSDLGISDDIASLCAQSNQRRKKLLPYIYTFLNTMMPSQLQKDKEKLFSCQEIMQTTLKEMQRILDITSDHSWQVTFEKLCQKFEELSETFFKNIAEIKKKCLDKSTLAEMTQLSFATRYNLKESDFRRAKYLQHQIDALIKLFSQPDNIMHFSKSKPLLVVDWLDKKEDYADLLFLLSTVLSKYLEKCLENKITLYQEILEVLHQQAQQCIDCWKEQTFTILRLFRIVRFYENWDQTLAKMKINDAVLNDWSSLFKLYRLFTYDKKTFFSQELKKEDAIKIFSALTLFIKQQTNFKNPQTVIVYLNDKKQAIKNELEKNKEALLKQYHAGKKMLAFFGLALTEQPTFKLGMQAFDVGYDDGFKLVEEANPEKTQAVYNIIDTMGNSIIPTWISSRLNQERDRKNIQHLAGLFAFGINQGALWLGYTYPAIAAFNRVVFSQFDTCVYLGQKIGLDEIDLLEKEAAMQWLSGLGLHWLMYGRDWIPATLSYTAATVADKGSVMIIDEMIKNKEYNSKAVGLAKFAIQSGVYSMVFSSALKKSMLFFQVKDTTTQALNTLGFFGQQPTIHEVQERYHKLALEYHPDKCLGTADYCTERTQTLIKINQAHTHLKSLR